MLTVKTGQTADSSKLFCIFFIAIYETTGETRWQIICIRSGIKSWDKQEIKSYEFRVHDKLSTLIASKHLLMYSVLTSKANFYEIQWMED